MRRVMYGAVVAAIVVLCGACAHGESREEAVFTPPESLLLDGVPAVPKSLMDALAPYMEFMPSSFAAWHPAKREMLVSTHLKNTRQLHRVAAPRGALEPVTDYPEPISGASFSPKHGESFVFARDEGGDEAYRLHRKSLAGGDAVPLSPKGERAGNVAWKRDGSAIAYTAQRIDRNAPEQKEVSVDIRIVDPRDPTSDRLLTRLPGGGWFSLSFSPDGAQLAVVRYESAASSELWLLDAKNGDRRKLTRDTNGERVAYAHPHWSADGKALYATSTRGSEFRRLVRIDLASAEERVLTPDIRWDVGDMTVSRDGALLAFTLNEEGVDRLHMWEASTLKPLPVPTLPAGVVSGLAFHDVRKELAFTLASARTPGDVYSFESGSTELTRWTQRDNPKLSAASFVEPELIRWKSFDGRTISGFLYVPPRKFEGKRPVLIDIHGGPEAQARPGFRDRTNYLVNELGIAVVFPNVRGSSGYGKTFLDLDNGRKREDSVKDIGALFDYLATRADLDATRVAVRGGSYGGYMTLAVATLYPERIRGAQSAVGISRFVSFLERTESYRRDLRRVEYGDERDPEMRAFLESISPLNRAERIVKPLFIVQGANDPRVPRNEAEQIVKKVKSGQTPVWYMVGKDEGHGFARKNNADYLAAATVMFLKRVLLD